MKMYKFCFPKKEYLNRKMGEFRNLYLKKTKKSGSKSEPDFILYNI